jgi:hypothetical protein
MRKMVVAGGLSVNSDAVVRLISRGSRGVLPIVIDDPESRGNPTMSLLLIVFVPVIVGGVAFAALLLGAAAAGTWEAVAERPAGKPRGAASSRPIRAQHEGTRARAA